VILTKVAGENSGFKKVTRDYKKMHIEECHNIIRMAKLSTMKWAGHTSRMADIRIAYRILVGKPERKRSLQTKMLMEGHIKMDLRDTD
jgi:hypothetical protein